MQRPWAQVVEILEWRAQRLERSERAPGTVRSNGERVTYTDDLSAVGIRVVRG
jgi:hypothetical protein